MQGRKPKPTAVKLLSGNPGKRAINHSEPRPQVVLPSAPDHFGNDEKNKWISVVQDLHPLGLVTSVDKDALAMYCVIYVRWLKAERMVREKGEIIKTAAGNIIQNPYLAIANRALDQLNKLGTEFGMTPSSRSRVKVELPNAESELEEMLFGKRIKVSENDR